MADERDGLEIASRAVSERAAQHALGGGGDLLRLELDPFDFVRRSEEYLH